MSINEHATKEQVNRLVNTALDAIKNKDKKPNWNQTLAHALDQLSIISRNLNSAKHSVQHFGRIMAADTHRHNAYRTNQSVNSKLGTLSSLEAFLAKEWKKIGDAINADMRKLPTEGKNEMELLDMLAGEIESFDKLLKQNVSQISKHQSNPHQTMIIQREISQLKTMPDLTAPSMLILISIGIRLFAMFVGAKSANSNK
ncbi:hypothetical protein [Microbulbifer sp. YPW1]|uniref:hypothetical protein n=1 Tax=Microbulbifer sp. YPW1 TaxID=2745199 RepID=UPI001599637C|nr:hypothetical protein [Microbulbifer sp. YPW1]QKX18158.1 hypothetical protein HUW35_14960 [Microbulbifer sp. YPW1]